jgi:hypothetical protein
MAREVASKRSDATALLPEANIRVPRPPFLVPQRLVPQTLVVPQRLVPHRLTPAERHRRICDLAYTRAEQRGFAPGGELDDWLEAEREVDAGRY